MGYTHLTAEIRYQIAILQRKGCSISEIAVLIRRSKSTVSRELKRNSGKRGYRPKQAQNLAESRRADANNAKSIPATTWHLVETLIRFDCSPQQVSGRLKLEHQISICHETIYQKIYADKRAGGTLHSHLRCRRLRRKRYGSGRSKRGRIPQRLGIEHRSPGVEKRLNIGHWEGDTVIGKNHKGALVTYVERKSRYTKICFVTNKTASKVAVATSALLRPLIPMIKTITFDNGLEFSAHMKISKNLKAQTFFANPYSSWERGTNENTNGLIRQYLPKKTSFENLTVKQIRIIEDRLNNRPRKCLDYRTPLEVMARSAKSRGVALRS